MLRRVALNVQMPFVDIQSVVDKDGVLLEALGTLDELQAVVEDEGIQKDLSNIMAAIALDKKVVNLDNKIVKLKKDFGKINNFLIFKKEKARRLNWIRTICRRAERRVVALNREKKIDENILLYLNRLSDFIYLLALKAEV